MSFLGWIVYGVFVLGAYENCDNPPANHVGIVGEESLPYVVPKGYNLVISSMGIEGPAPHDLEQVGMALWLGNMPCTNDKSIMSCTTMGGSTQLINLAFIIPAGQTVNARMMNNTHIPWANGWYIQGTLVPTK